MCNGNHRAPLHQRSQLLLDRRFDIGVERGRGLVEHKDRRIFQNHAGGDQLLVPNVIRAIGLALVMTPLSALAMTDIAREETAAASGLFNMTRNLGGAFGTAILVTFLTKREQFHSNIINSHVELTDPATVQRVESLKQHFLSQGADIAAATQQAYIAIGKTIHHQAELMGFADTFGLLGAVVLLGVVSILCMRNMKGAPAGGAAH